MFGVNITDVEKLITEVVPLWNDAGEPNLAVKR
jgi:hypothetical protein